MLETEAQDFQEPRTEVRPRSSFLPDAGHLWLIFRRRLWAFLVVFVAILALVILYTARKPTLYSATATVLVEPRKPQVIDVDPVAAGVGADTAAIDTEVQILSSRRLASRVARVLETENYPGFRTRVTPVEGRDDTHPMAGRLLGMVSARRSGVTYLINITAVANDGTLAAKVANEFARQYLAQQTETKSLSADEARDFLQGELNDLRSNVVAADAELQRYKVANGLMSAEGATMAEQEVSTLNQEIARARAELAQKQGQLNAARSQLGRGGGGGDVPAALQSGTVGELRRKEAEISGRLAELSARYGEQHPDVKMTVEELADARVQLQRQIDRVVGSLQAEVQAASSRLTSLEASQQRAKGSLESNNSAQVGLLELQRKAEAAQAIYTTFLNRSKEMVSQEGLIRPDARIESLARVPLAPFSPNYLVTAMFGLIAATVGGLAAIALSEYLDARVRTKADIEDGLRVRYIGAIPQLRSVARLPDAKQLPFDYLVNHPFSAFSESFRALRAALMLGHPETPKVIAVTSALPREGKSTTSICLARTIANAGSRTVLVDCDARRRSTSEMLLPSDWDGLARYLDGEIDLDDALFQDPRTDLQVLGFNAPARISSELYTEVRLRRLLEALRARFDVVLMDTAPVLGIAETRSIAAAADAVLLLARWRTTSVKAADTAVEILLASGAKLQGVALTLVDVRHYASTGQQDVYSYHRKFAGYYAD